MAKEQQSDNADKVEDGEKSQAKFFEELAIKQEEELRNAKDPETIKELKSFREMAFKAAELRRKAQSAKDVEAATKKLKAEEAKAEDILSPEENPDK